MCNIYQKIIQIIMMICGFVKVLKIWLKASSGHGMVCYLVASINHALAALSVPATCQLRMVQSVSSYSLSTNFCS